MISVNLTTILFKIEHINIIACFIHNALNTETSASNLRGYSQKVGSAYQRMNEGRYSRVGISPFWFTTSWTCRLSGRSPPSAYWFFHGVRQENKCDCHLCDALYSYIRCSSSLSPLRRFQRVCVPIPPYQFLHYWYNCRCREHTRVRLNNKQKYQNTMIKLLLRQKNET